MRGTGCVATGGLPSRGQPGLQGLATTTLVFPLVRSAARRRLIRGWSGRLLGMLAVEARVHGELPAAGGNLLVVSNHVSWLDIFVLHSVQPVRFIAKSDLARWPLAGRLIRGSGTLFVERESQKGIVIDYELVDSATHFWAEHLPEVEKRVGAYLDKRLAAEGQL